MKNSVTYFMILLFTVTPLVSIHATETDPPKTVTELPADVRVMINRIEEIKEMDKSEMSRAEKRALRKEARALKAEVRSTGNGLYISAGAVIVILLLIIIL